MDAHSWLGGAALAQFAVSPECRGGWDRGLDESVHFPTNHFSVAKLEAQSHPQPPHHHIQSVSKLGSQDLLKLSTLVSISKDTLLIRVT